MTTESKCDSVYNTLLTTRRLRDSRVHGRDIEAEADADRGRVLFSAPFRRLQNKAQVFSLESNAAVRSRLTHSLEVSSIGRLVALEALNAFEEEEVQRLGIIGNELALITFVETACLVHDLGNPPFGHFGELAIGDWFHANESVFNPGSGGGLATLWSDYYSDFRFFDGNPQGIRILTRLQPSHASDRYGMNLTATTIAATIKYPWSPNKIGSDTGRKKAGYFLTESRLVKDIQDFVNITENTRHPLVYLMEAADDIAYCISDIEDGIEKGIISSRAFSEFITKKIENLDLVNSPSDEDKDDVKSIFDSLKLLDQPQTSFNGQTVEMFVPMLNFRSAVVRLLARHAGLSYRNHHDDIIKGNQFALMKKSRAREFLEALNEFARSNLYNSPTVRNREITAQAVLTGLLDAYKPIMSCNQERFKAILAGQHRDPAGNPIAWESSLLSRTPKKFLAVYHAAVKDSNEEANGDSGQANIMEQIHRMRFVVDYISGMTDEFALQSFRLVSGMDTSPFRS